MSSSVRATENFFGNGLVLESCKRRKNGVILHCLEPVGDFKVQVSLTAITDRVIRVRVAGLPNFVESIKTTSVVQKPGWNVKVSVERETPGAPHLVIRLGRIVVHVTRAPFRLEYFDGGLDGGPGGRLGGSPDQRPFLSEKTSGGLRWDGWKFSLNFALGEDEHFYGLGQGDQLKGRVNLDHRGSCVHIWNQHNPRPARLTFPFVLSTRRYGLFVDNAHRALFDFGVSDPETFSYIADGGIPDYYVILGNDLYDVLSGYTSLTGRPALLPRWALGYLQSRFGYRDRAEVEELASTFRAKKIPCDGIILDLFWFKHMGDLAFNKKEWPEPGKMIAGLAERGFRVVVIEEPYLTPKSKNFEPAGRLGYLCKRANGSTYVFPFWGGEAGLVDFTSPAARAWWAARHRTLFKLGIAGWWTDLNEPEVHLPDMVHHGGPAHSVHNLQALQMIQAVYAASQRYAPGKRVFIMSRSGWAGMQRYGATTWSGDVAASFSALANQPALGLNMGLAGVAGWNTDIGGFWGDPSPELYVRWMQFGCFNPICRPHGAQSAREPWAFGEEAELIVTEYIKLRYRLLPYLYSYMHQSYATGAPLMRPLILEFPDDEKVTSLSDEYLFGKEILVAPVLEEGGIKREVYLPAGVWHDFWTGRRYVGPAVLEVPAPLAILPLFIRGGAIIPLAGEMDFTGQCRWDNLTLDVYPAPGRDGCLELYEDDGETTAYTRGEYSLTTIRCRADPQKIMIEIGPPCGTFPFMTVTRDWLLKVHSDKAPSRVTLLEGEGRERDLPLQTGPSLAAGWWVDKAAGCVLVMVPQAAGGCAVKMNINVDRDPGGE